jgi:hypothetical protein
MKILTIIPPVVGLALCAFGIFTNQRLMLVVGVVIISVDGILTSLTWLSRKSD